MIVLEDCDRDNKNYNGVVESRQVLEYVISPSKKCSLSADVVQAGVQLPYLGTFHRIVDILLKHSLDHQWP